MSAISTTFLALFLLAHVEMAKTMKSVSGKNTRFPHGAINGRQSIDAQPSSSVSVQRKSASISARLTSAPVLQPSGLRYNNPLMASSNRFGGTVSVVKRFKVTMSADDDDDMLFVPFQYNVPGVFAVDGSLSFTPAKIEYWFDDNQPNKVTLAAKIDKMKLKADCSFENQEEGVVYLKLEKPQTAQAEITFPIIGRWVNQCEVKIPFTITVVLRKNGKDIHIPVIEEEVKNRVQVIVQNAICKIFLHAWNENPETMPGGGNFMVAVNELKELGQIIDEHEE